MFKYLPTNISEKEVQDVLQIPELTQATKQLN